MAIICEVCQSTDFIKMDNNFVCQTCGMKYTLEEVKKMMVGVSSVEQPKTKGINIDEYLGKIETLFDQKDFEMIMKYCDEILNVDENHVEANLYKGSAVGWDTLNISSATGYYLKALNVASEERKKEIREYIKEDLDNIYFYKSELLCEATLRSPNENKDAFGSFINDWFSEKLIFGSLGIDVDYKPFKWRKMIIEKMAYAQKTRIDTYCALDYPTKPIWSEFLEYLMGIQLISVYAMISGDFNEDLYRDLDCASLILERDAHMLHANNLSAFNDAAFYHNKVDRQSINDSLIASKISKEHKVIQKLEKQIQQVKVKEYWNEHQDKYNELNDELKKYSERLSVIEKFSKDIKYLDGYAEYKVVLDEIEDLKANMKALGLFKKAEKEKIQSVIYDKEALAAKLLTPLQNLMKQYADEVADIEYEIEDIEDYLENPLGE